MKRRGLQHVEAILAFVLFFGFLVAALYFFNPLDTKRVLDSSLYYASDGILKNTTTVIESYSIVINRTVPDSVKIALSPQTPDLVGVRVEDKNGVNLTSSYEQGNVEFNRAGNTYVNIIFGKDFVNGPPISGGKLLSVENYTIASSTIRKISSEKMFLALNKTYYESYQSLKVQFNTPQRVDFGFSLRFSPTDQIESQINIPQNVEVISSKNRIEVIRANGDVAFADLFTRVW